ncbi:hypothetical protein KSP39_PZI012456 [Platanthera zijinensis]|uniref:Uncharacterized protein n=1 Tax=Platanthera zijinensis TaxID=2320716 RepID=A0AAP0G4Y4_9ASPA
MATVDSLNQATAYESPAHSSTDTQSEITFSSHCLGAHGFMFYFTPRWGFFLPFPHSTTLLSVTQQYLALQGGPFNSHGIPRARATQVRACLEEFPYHSFGNRQTRKEITMWILRTIEKAVHACLDFRGDSSSKSRTQPRIIAGESTDFISFVGVQGTDSSNATCMWDRPLAPHRFSGLVVDPGGPLWRNIPTLSCG